MKSFKSIFAALAVLFLLGAPAMAQPEIYAIGTNFVPVKLPPDDGEIILPDAPLPIFPDSILYKLNPLTGEPTEIGPITGYTRCTGLDFNDTGRLFAVCDKIGDRPMEPAITTNNGLFESYLLILDRNTAQPTEVGPLQLSRGDFVSDISFRSDGILFAHINGLTNGAGGEEGTTNTVSANSLATINTNTGQANVIGETGLEDFFSAIGFSELDILFQCTDNDAKGLNNAIATMNQNTGQSTIIGTLIFPPGFDTIRLIASKDNDIETNHFYGLLNTTRGQVICCDDEILLTREEDGFGNFLITIDQETDQVEVIGLISNQRGEDFGALAVLGKKIPTEVPTMSEYGLIVTVVMLLGAAVFFLRRRQVKSSI